MEDEENTAKQQGETQRNESGMKKYFPLVLSGVELAYKSLIHAEEENKARQHQKNSEHGGFAEIFRGYKPSRNGN